MSEEQLKALLEKAKADTSLQGKLKAAADADAVVSIANEAGFSISADDLKNVQSEISADELEKLAGGLKTPSNNCSFQTGCPQYDCTSRLKSCP